MKKDQRPKLPRGVRPVDENGLVISKDEMWKRLAGKGALALRLRVGKHFRIYCYGVLGLPRREPKMNLFDKDLPLHFERRPNEEAIQNFVKQAMNWGLDRRHEKERRRLQRMYSYRTATNEESRRHPPKNPDQSKLF